MKRFGIAVILVVAVILDGNVLEQFGVPNADASRQVVNAFSYGSVDYHRVRGAFKKAAPAARAAMVEQVLIWTKAYVSSPQFAKDYAAQREEAKPQKEQRVSVDEELKQRRAQQAADFEESKKSIAEMPKEYRAAAEEGLKAAAESMKQMDTPEFRKMERESLIAERKADEEQYQQQLAEWSESYPADPRVLVRQRLQQFLDATGDVDYDAKLVNRYGKQRFANEDYESRSSEWKLAYRAGKEPTDKARAFARAWLAELR